MVDNFIQSYKKAPKEIIIDADPTDDAAHGNQENNYYHGYYKHYCFLPLHIYCGKHLLVLGTPQKIYSMIKSAPAKHFSLS